MKKNQLYLTSSQIFVYWVRKNKSVKRITDQPTLTLFMNKWNKYHFLITILDEWGDTKNISKITTDEKFHLSSLINFHSHTFLSQTYLVDNK